MLAGGFASSLFPPHAATSTRATPARRRAAGPRASRAVCPTSRNSVGIVSPPTRRPSLSLTATPTRGSDRARTAILRPVVSLARRWAGIVSAAALFGVAVPRAALSHEVKTKDGKTYEGTVVSQDDKTVVIETTFDGKKELARVDVASVDTSISPLRDQLTFRLKDAADVAALGKVADWAKSKGWKPDSAEIKDVWTRVIKLDPHNARAHKALGHVQVGANWMTPEEKAAAEAAAHEAEMRAKGLVLYD